MNTLRCSVVAAALLASAACPADAVRATALRADTRLTGQVAQVRGTLDGASFASYSSEEAPDALRVQAPAEVEKKVSAAQALHEGTPLALMLAGLAAVGFISRRRLRG
jgi:hypothetical protein